MTETKTCPLARAMDIIGDRWSLLIVRDLLRGKHRYNDFSNSAEKIPTNILASRLKRLQQQGVVDKQPYQQRPLRYEYHLTDKGLGLLPVIQQLALWSQQHHPECYHIPAEFFALSIADAARQQG